ncbi:hypothetical protein HK15_07500 [Acetobacter orientalis]|uniref:Uncharacterized protein n=1 Tax=Acetobacter orientalis TaxID=146474 RepID=A0A252BBF5_9PROT|nr:hypothetical protein HK15_07500 [Acetobacter orientalis]
MLQSRKNRALKGQGIFCASAEKPKGVLRLCAAYGANWRFWLVGWGLRLAGCVSGGRCFVPVCKDYGILRVKLFQF